MAIVAAISFASPSLAKDCPDFALYGAPELRYSDQDLWVEVRHQVTAGGSVDLADCGKIDGAGHVARRADFNLWLTENAGNRMIRFIVDSPANCDTVMLINTPSGAWLYNDDGDSIDPVIRVEAARAGRYDIWVGTYGSTTCPGATLRVESF